MWLSILLHNIVKNKSSLTSTLSWRTLLSTGPDVGFAGLEQNETADLLFQKLLRISIQQNIKPSIGPSGKVCIIQY